MEEKRFTLFWKKFLVMNLGIILILIRILGMIEGFLTRKANDISIFPQQTENGYPFFESINCDIRNLVPIVDSITKKKDGENYENQDKIIFNSFLNNLKSQKCSFYDKLNICKDNKKCFNELNEIKLNMPNIKNKDILFNYHSSNNEGQFKISNIIELFQYKNEFINNKYNNNVEIETYYKLMSGYKSFLNIKLYEQNINNKNYDILKEITNHEEKVNNLLYFHSLFLKAHSLIYKNKNSSDVNTIKYIDQCLRENDDQFTYKNTIFYISEKNRQKIIDIFENDLKHIINCIPDFNTKYSYSIDIQAIKTMIKLLLGVDDNISKNDKKMFTYFLKELSKSIKTIFIADVEIKQKANEYEKYYPYVITFFIVIFLIGLIFLDRYFIKNRDYYNQNSRLLENYKRERYNFMYNNKHHQYLAKLKEMEEKKKEEEEKKKEEEEKKKKNSDKNNIINNNVNIQGDKDKCTKEELEYIQNLANNNKGDFILSK